jgi:hypothetical protein
MAYLLNEQILTILQNAQKPEELTSCHNHDIRAKFHVEPTLEASRLVYKDQFIAWVGNIINKKKLEVFKQLLTLPIETVEFTEGVFDELIKIFEAQDRHIGYQFTNPELTADFTRYLNEINDQQFWQTKGFQTMKSAINSIVILDLPAIKKEDNVTDKFARPYYYFLDVQKVKAFEVNSKLKFEYIIFCNKHNDTIIHAFDDGHFRTYKEVERGDPKQQIAAKYSLISEEPHGLGYTPARSFWTTPFEECSKLQKRGPQSNSLGKFDWLLLLYTFTKHVELYAGFPVDVMYEQRCDYRDASGNECQNGQVRRMVNTDLGGVNQTVVFDACPNCKDKQLLGPGTVLTAPAMASKDDPDLLAGMNRISADKDSLEYLLNRIERYEVTISTNMIGYIAEGIREAMNKDQVASMTESQRNCLAEVRDNFENIHRWALEGLARLRYGSQALISVSCNYGSKWFIHSVEKLQEQFKESKANGMANFELSSQFEQILLTKYKNNPGMLERVRTLAAIEPYQNYTVSDLATMNEKFGLNKNLVRLKIDFNTYVSRFEREFMNISSFMQFSPFEVKVAFIQEKLLGYVAEDYKAEATNPTATEGGDNIATPIDIEAESKAKLKGSVGGVQGILSIQTSVYNGTTDYDAAVVLLGEIFGFDTVKAKAILGPKRTQPNPVV